MEKKIGSVTDMSHIQRKREGWLVSCRHVLVIDMPCIQRKRIERALAIDMPCIQRKRIERALVIDMPCIQRKRKREG